MPTNNIIINPPPEPEMMDEPGSKQKPKKYTVFGVEEGKEKPRYHTNFDYELECSTEKSRAGIGPNQIVTVEHYNNPHLRKRDVLVIVRKLYPKRIREYGWSRKVQMTIPRDVFKEEKKTTK